MSICRTCSGAISEIRAGRYCSDKCKSERKLRSGIGMGAIFGKLTLVEPCGLKKLRDKWRCLCECGNEVELYRTRLARGCVNSCGCVPRIYRNRGLERKKTADCFSGMFSSYIKGASARKIEFLLTLDQAKSIFESKCYYCGTSPQKKKHEYRSGEYIYANGIDRVRNSDGYSGDNCVPCCTRCNKAKGTLSMEEFIEMCINVSALRGRVAQQMKEN